MRLYVQQYGCGCPQWNICERIALLVDGSNLYHYLRELKLTGLAEFDYKAFAEFLARGRFLASSTYYIGKVRSRGDAKGEELRRWQQKLVARLQSIDPL